MKAVELLESLDHREKLEDLCRRFGTPHIPEYDLEAFQTLYHFELTRALDGKLPPAYRGRVRRLLGDLAGAAQDLKAALDQDPGCAVAHAWLGELDLERPEAEQSLSRALELEPDLACARLYRGAFFLMKGRLAEARVDLERLVAVEPKSGLGFLLLGLAWERGGQKGRAAKAYEAAAASNPVCSAACLLRSRAATTDKDRARWFREAYNVSPVLGFITLQIDRTLEVESPRYVKRITRFCFDRPEQVGAYYKREATQSHFSHFPAEDYGFVEKLVARQDHMAWAHGFFGRAACYTPRGAKEGVARLDKAIALCPQAGWTYAWRANARRIFGDHEGALGDFADCIRLQPFYHRAFVWRGSLYRKLGRLKEALADLDRAIAMDPYYSLTYFERSVVRRGLGDLVGSAFDLDRAFMLDHRYSWVFKTGGEPTPEEIVKGLAQLDAALSRHGSVASLWVWRGQLKLQRRTLPEAFEDLEHAIQLDPHHYLAWAWQGYGLLEAGQAERAAEALRRALELEPRLWIAYNWLAQAEQRRGRKREARAVLDAVLEEKPKTPWVWYLRARFEHEAGRSKGALAPLKRALLLDGKYPEAYLLLAQVKLALKDLRGARDAADRCVEIAPNLGRAYVVRAAVNEAAGRGAEVLKDYRTALKDFPYLFNPEQRAELEKVLAA